MATSIKESNERTQVQFSDGKLTVDTKMAAELLALRSKLNEEQKTRFNKLLLTKAGFIKLTKLLN